LKPQQTGTGLLIRYGEIATTSGSTNFAGSSNSRTSRFWRRLCWCDSSPGSQFPFSEEQTPRGGDWL